MSVESVMERYETALMDLPNVIGVGVGERGREPVIKVFVSRKVAEGDLEAHELVPTELDGYETDVEEIGAVSAQRGLGQSRVRTARNQQRTGA